MYPLELVRYTRCVNLKLSDRTLQQVCRELMAGNPALSGRRLRAVLRQRFGGPCRTDRVYALWRLIRAEQVRAASDGTGLPDRSELMRQIEQAQRRIGELERSLLDAEQRALRAEERERIHQDRWAQEIDLLRQQLDRSRR
jgi:hypothetical protein